MRQYKIGDVVQIRQWDDMAKEFGITNYGAIHCIPYVFVKEMKKYCGKRLEIIAISHSVNNANKYYYLSGAPTWAFTSEMFEKGVLSILITRRQECMK